MSEMVAEQCPRCGANLPPGGEQVICAYCGTRFFRYRSYALADSSHEKVGMVQGMRFKPFVCTDAGTGLEAFRMVIPAGWEFRGGVHWLSDNPGMPAVVAFQISPPGGVELFEVLPNQSFYWTNNPMTSMMFPIGSRYFGNEVRPPMPAQQALRELVIPRFRGQATNLQLVKLENAPELARHVQAAAQTLTPSPHQTSSADAAKARLHYRLGPHALEEELYCAVELNRVLMPAMMGMIEHLYWLVDYVCACRAALGQLDRLGDLFRAIAHSIRINPQWFSCYLQISRYLIQNQIQHIHNIGQLSRQISQMHHEISDEMMHSYYQRQAIYDRLSADWSQAIRGVDEYYDPLAQRSVELPGGYGYGWVNHLGEYIVTDDPNFNPNLGSNLNWEPMQHR